eukprot:g8827.t1
MDAFLAYAKTTVYFPKLVLCLLIDFCGASSYLLPGIGELGDVGYAPLQAYLLLKLFGSHRVAALGFLEELGPGTDFVPTATIAWLLENTSLLPAQLNLMLGVLARGRGR